MFNKPYPWENAKKILIASHAFADPDSIGSMIALAYFLREGGKDVDMLSTGGVPENLAFLTKEDAQPGATKEHKILSSVETSNYDQIIVVDCGDLALVRLPGIEVVKHKIVNIDHHEDNKFFGEHNFVDSSCAATSEIIYGLLKDEVDINGFVATALLAGIAGDTGSFRHANTSAKSLKISADLMNRGARLGKIMKNLFSPKHPRQLKAWARALESAWHDERSQAFAAVITGEDIQALGASDDDFAGIVEILNTCTDAKFAVFARQRGEEVKVSLRSENYKGVDVAELAHKYGGGGHTLSAGFSVPGKLIRQNNQWHILPVGKM